MGPVERRKQGHLGQGRVGRALGEAGRSHYTLYFRAARMPMRLKAYTGAKHLLHAKAMSAWEISGDHDWRMLVLRLI